MASASKKVYWNPPTSGWLKLSMDGSSSGNQAIGEPSYRGIIRNDCGDWVCGYAEKIGFDTSLSSEIYGIMMRLRLIKIMELNDIIICEAALLRITIDSVDGSDSLSWVINFCKQDMADLDMADLRCYIVHVKRDVNLCADLMTRLGRMQDEDFVALDDSLTQLIPLLEEDANARASPKHSSFLFYIVSD